MSAFGSLFSLITQASKALAPMITSPGPLVNAGKALVDAYDNLKSVSDTPPPADAEAAHDALFNKVKAHANSTLSRLEG